MTDFLGRRQFLAGAAIVAAGAVTGSRISMAAGLQVNIVNTDGAASACLQEMIRRVGYLDQFGVEAKFTNIVGTPKLVDALVKGEADACIYSGFSPVLSAIEQGAALKIVAGANLLPVQAVFAKSPGITKLKDLEGKTVGVGATGALLHQVMYAALLKAGADPAKVKFVDIGSSAQVWRAILDNKVDAGPSEASYLDVQNSNGVHVLTDGKFWDTVPDYTNQASYVSDAAIKNKREALVKTLAAHAKLYRLIHDAKSWDAYAEARKAALKNDTPAEARGQWDFYQARKPFAVDLVLTEERIRYVQQLNVDMGLQKKILPFEQVADMSLARDALKLIA